MLNTYWPLGVGSRMMRRQLGLLSSPSDPASARQATATYLEEDDFTGSRV
jgi:hypothetical protein